MVLFLLAQAAALAAGGASLLTYMTRLEVRVSTMEIRGAAYTVDRMDTMKQQITVLEQMQQKNAASIERVVDIMTQQLRK